MIVTGGCMISFWSPVQFGSEKDIVTGGGRERQWRVGVATDGRDGVSVRTRLREWMGSVFARPTARQALWDTWD